MVDGVLYFAASDGLHGLELWRSDGTVDGTQLVYDLAPGPASSSPGNLFANGERLFFSALRDAESGFEPWTLFTSYDQFVHLPLVAR